MFFKFMFFEVSMFVYNNYYIGYPVTYMYIIIVSPGPC